jgi:hypothetical protein
MHGARRASAMQHGIVTDSTSASKRDRPGYGLFMFVGTPGAGKSTLSRWLWEHLTDQGVPARLLPEEEVYGLQALQPFAAVSSRADPADISLLLDAVRSLCREWRASGSAWITDQFLPAFHWLFATYPSEHVRAYAEDLVPVLTPLHPLVIHLEADQHTAWERAVADRGQEWSDWMVEVFSRRTIPLYPGEPIRDLGSLLRLFAWGQSQSRSLLADWPVECVSLKTDRMPLGQAKETLLNVWRSTRGVPAV